MVTRRSLLMATIAAATSSQATRAEAPSPGTPAGAETRPRSPDGALLFVGSSTIRLWPDLAQRFTPRPVVQRGIGGATLDDVIRRRGRLFAPHRPRAIILYAGENDIARGASAADVVDRFVELRRRLDGTPAGAAPLVFITPKPSPARFELWPEMQAAGDAIAALPEPLRPDVVIRPAPWVLKADGRPDRDVFHADGLHFSARGYEHLTADVRRALATIGAD